MSRPQCEKQAHYGGSQYDRLIGHQCTRNARVRVLVIPTGEYLNLCKQHLKQLEERWAYTREPALQITEIE